MKFLRGIYLFLNAGICVLTLLFNAYPTWAIDSVPKPLGFERDELINQELNRVHSHINNSNPKDTAPAISSDLHRQNFTNEVNDVPSPPAEVFAETIRDRAKKIELALQLAWQHYQTDNNFPYYYSQTYNHGNEVEKDGLFYGLYASYTFRKPYTTPIHTWRELREEEGMPFFSFLRIEGEFDLGKQNYDSYVTGKLKDKSATKMDIRALGGYDFLSQDNTFMVTPYLGIGYLKYTDKTGGWEDYSLFGHAFFKNTYQFVYLPIGVETLKELSETWDLNFKLEGNLMLYGDVLFALHKAPGPLDATDATSGLPIQIFLQDSSHLRFHRGVGLRTSFKLIKKFDQFNIFTEPSFSVWRVTRSNKEYETSVATNGANYISVEKTVYEPPSYRFEYGVKLGVQF